MKGPAVKVRGRRRPAQPRIPYGKVSLRLRLFEQQRALDLTDVSTAAAQRPLLEAVGRTTAAAPGRAPANGATSSPYLDAIRQKDAMIRMAPPALLQAAWRPLGPFSVPHGQSYGSGPGSRPAVSGRVAAIAVDPGDPLHLLVGAAGGGVWESHDEGATWLPRTDGQPSLATGAIAFDPSDPQTVYAGTGEGNFFARLGTGLLRSTDGGTTWSTLAVAPFASTGFYDIVVDPLNSNHLLAGTTAGLYESSNAGASWTQRRAQRTWKISMHPAVVGTPNSTNEVFAACGDGLFVSNDGGTTWTAVALSTAPASWARLAVAHAPSNPATIYAFGSDGTSAFLWQQTTPAGGFVSVAPPPGIQVNQGWYDWFLSVAPTTPGVIYLGAINVHRGVQSSSGSWTWTNISAKTSGDSIHPDQHAIAISPTNSNVIYVGNDGGLFRSPNAGVNWTSLNKGLCISEFEYLTQHPQFESWLLGGTQDNGTLRYEGGEAWYHIQDGDGGDCGTNDTSPYTTFHTFYSMGLERSTTGGGWGSWSYIGPPTPSNYSALFYPPVDVRGPLVAQAGATIFISTDSGNTWTQVVLPAGIASALAASTPTRIYAGTTLGDIYRTDLVGAAWQAATTLTRPRAGYLSDICVDPTNPNRLWVTYSSIFGGHVYRSDNGGTTWTDVSANLPVIPVNAIVLDPANTDIAYVAADVGVWRTANAGGNWTAFSSQLPNALAKDLVFHQPSRLLRVGLQSRGVWEIAVDAPTMPDVEVYLRDDHVDIARRLPSLSGVPDPFAFGSLTTWWQCRDIKVDAPPYQQPNSTDVDFSVFEDDHGVFAAGLMHENPVRTRPNRVFVQVHNRGQNPAVNVAVKVFTADASLGLPPLPAGFWTNFPNNNVAPGSPWQPMAPHKVIPIVPPGQAQVVAFDWTVPASAADHSCALAITSADNDSINTTELNLAALVPGQPKCGLRNLAVVDPGPVIGNPLRYVLLRVWAGKPELGYVIGLDPQAAPLLAGLLLSPGLSKVAQTQKLKSAKFPPTQIAVAKRYAKAKGLGAEMLDWSRLYEPGRGQWLHGIKIDPRKPELIVAVLKPKPRPGRCSIVQWTDEGVAVGGFTFEARGT